MTAIDQARLDLEQRRADSAEARRRQTAARERLARLRDREPALRRAGDAQRGALRRLEAEIRQAAIALDDANNALRVAVDAERAAADRFGQLIEPHRAIQEWNDRIPILMMPVRIETRFKRDGERPELWVRVYPDDCSIDTFEPMLSENEVADAKVYWQAMWAACAVEEQERGAWRGLAGTLGSGRAEWIVGNYEPLNANEKPPQGAADIILTIPTEDPPADGEKQPLLDYWSAVWTADGDRVAIAAARAQLSGGVGGDARADELIAAYVPSNLAVKPAPPKTKQNTTVAAALVVFPKSSDLDLKRRSWSRAATAELLPDRFMLLAWRNGAQDLMSLGAPILTPPVVTPDPSAPDDEQLQHDAGGNLIVPDSMRWMTDFDEAVKIGMGFRIPLTFAQATDGFDRVLVLGLRFSADEKRAQHELETLLTHHRFGRSGFAVVPQGSPTNNTDDGPSALSRTEDPDVSFDQRAKGALFNETTNWLDKRDGQWLAEYLGLDVALFQNVRNSDGKDQADARAMNVALWPATLGYWMEAMMSPIFSDDAVARTREFFNRYVIGRGAVPAIRIGKQPYGILPTTAFSRIHWIGSGREQRDPYAEFLRQLYLVLLRMDAEWHQLTAGVSYTGKNGNPHQVLLDIIGLNADSVEYAQRFGESPEQLFNRLNLEGLGGWLGAFLIEGLESRARQLLLALGYTGRDDPEMIAKFFFSTANPLNGPLVDDRPLSESSPIREYTADHRNYLQWLRDAANTSLSSLYEQTGFANDTPPRALLYLMLRHALQLGYYDTSLRLHEIAGLMTNDAVRAARRDETFMHIRQQPKGLESHYELLYKPAAPITGDAVTTIGDYIGRTLLTLEPARYLRDQSDALARLVDASTARLERAFAEHIDCCSYRLDAWLLGLVHYQLARMRNIGDELSPAPSKPAKGIYLGAYAWVEDLRPQKRQLQRFEPDDREVAADFDEPNAPPLMIDSSNEGYIHAPSLNHAVAAAVLRNGYISNADRGNPGSLAVNVTSERVRVALGILEGIRGGQSIGALLGYQFERGLHDRYALGVEVDQFIYDLRGAFPLASNRMASTQTGSDVDIRLVEARNVIDGLALVNQIRASGAAAYPFGKAGLPFAPAPQAAAINAEAERIVETYDAVADLAMAEGVYEAVIGNYDRVASTLDAYSKGNFPPEPQVARTPFDGIGLTHRVAVHFESQLDPHDSPVVGVAMTPRAMAEPAVNRWLASMLPSFHDVACIVAFHDHATNVAREREITFADLAIQPADVLRLFGEENTQAMSELDDRIISLVAPDARPAAPIAIRYMSKNVARFSFFEVTPLVRHLRRLLHGARPLRATDLALTKEATRGDDSGVFVDAGRITLVRDAMVAFRADLQAFTNTLQGDLAANDDGTTIAHADVDDLAALLARAAETSIAQSGWGFAYDFRGRIFRSVIAKAHDVVTRWDQRLIDYDDVIAHYDALPVGATDQERIALLTRAERLISTSMTNPFPATLAAYRAALDVKRAAFVAKRGQFAAIDDSSRTTVADLFADFANALPADAFDLHPPAIDDEIAQTIAFANDVVSVANVVLRELTRRIDAAAPLITAGDPQSLSAAAKALLGDDMVIIPEFTLRSAQGDELTSCLAATDNLLQYVVTAGGDDFPVDTWLYGVARTRTRLRDWEQITHFAGAFGGPDPALVPLQLPFDANDSWLALEFPSDLKLDHERLLYTAHFATPFDKSVPQCGILIDEWTEIIPANATTTGLTLHYDRPNNEAPQTMLLVTPTRFIGAWDWADLVDALNETLDFAKRRAVEPVHLESTAFAQFLPATITAVTMRQLTISANLALNNDLARWV